MRVFNYKFNPKLITIHWALSERDVICATEAKQKQNNQVEKQRQQWGLINIT